MLRIGAFGRPLAHVRPITKSIHPYFFAIANKLTHRVGGCAHITRGTASSHPPYHTKPYQTIPYHTILASIIPYHTTHTTIPNHMHHTIPQDYTIHTPLYQPTLLTIPNHTILACTIPHHNTLTPQYTTPRFTIQHHTPLYQPTLLTIPYHTILA